MKFASRTELEMTAGVVLLITLVCVATGSMLDTPALNPGRSNGVEVASRRLADSCDPVTVTGGEAGGEYSAVPFLLSEDRHIYVTAAMDNMLLFIAGSLFTDIADDDDVRRRHLFLEHAGSDAHHAHELGDERGMPWNRKGEVLASLASAASRERTGSTLSAIRGATNTLELCTDGLWLISPISLDDDTTSTTSTTSTTNTTSTVSFPLYFTMDCAEHPEDISSTWYVFEDSSDTSEIDDAEDLDDVVLSVADLSVTCAGYTFTGVLTSSCVAFLLVSLSFRFSF